jgi:hypothetical protein
MNSSNVPKAKRRFRLRRLLILLLALVALALVLALVLPPIMLRVLNFVPRGNVQSFWNEVQQETGTAPAALPSILQTRLPPEVVALPTSTQTLSATPTTIIPPTLQPTLTKPVATQAAVTAQATETPSETLVPTLPPSPTVTPTATNPYAAWFSSAIEPERIRIFSKGYLDMTLSSSKAFADALWVGKDTNDLPLGIIEFDENAIPQLCALYFNNCRDPRFRIDKVDFRPSGMLVYGSLNIANLFWQQVGVVMVLDDKGLTLKVAGMVWNEEVYEVPKTGPIATTLTDLTSRGNAALSTLDIFATGYEMTIAQMYFDDNRFIVVLKNALPN